MNSEQIFKIAIIGPESTGKTTLAKDLADHLQTGWVPEYARKYLDGLDRAYEQADLVNIARGQVQAEDEALKTAGRYLICDTNLVVLKIWSEYRYGELDQWIAQQLMTRHYDLYLLTACDVPWEYDLQRENPHDRQELFDQYHNFLKQRDVPFHVLEGGRAQRLKAALQVISDL